MNKKYPKKVLILGSGGLRIGQAGEFDYSGSQAIKALKQEGIKTVLVNPNIATVQTDNDMADTVYFQPLNENSVTKILEKEKPDAIMLSFGGQTALNLGLLLGKKGVFNKLNIKVLGTPVTTINITEDRELFKQALAEIGTKTALSEVAYSQKQAIAAANRIGYPIMLRSAYSLGGLGSGRINNEQELINRTKEVLNATSQILIEEYLAGWKEVEYEVVRDVDGNIITVCNMENLDPMGIHTGESIVVAPSQTLSNTEYHHLREVALRTIDHLGIIGECNIQYAVNPANGDYRVIEVNARLSRSSALASKATGYPLAFVAAHLMLGKKLYEIKNSVTGTTTAFFEPALDYIAVKMPRWDLSKLKSSDHNIGSEMKSVGEVMALGRSFPEALQKAIRMLNIGAEGIGDHSFEFKNINKTIKYATDKRLFAVYKAILQGMSIKDIHKLSAIDNWFLYHLKEIANTQNKIATQSLSKDLLYKAKQQGFSDKTIAKITNSSQKSIRIKRVRNNIIPVIKQIDTLAGEFDAETNYLYLTYNGDTNDIKPLGKKAYIILGSGPYCIGSSVEFDWCAVNAAKTLAKNGYKTIIINSNPETVSTDFDRSDRLYFDELTFERVQDIADFEGAKATVVSVGGQIANNLALPLAKSHYPILGTQAVDIDRAEDRQKFSAMLNKLNIDQPNWCEITSLKAAQNFADKTGYPLLIRPSYVLSGGAMNVIQDKSQLKKYLNEATVLSPDHPVVISQFITHAKELEIDGVANNGELVIYAISEHIENAGIHSGDATVVYPAQTLYLETVRRARNIAKKVAKNLKITGPFNIQFLAKDNQLKVIECNVRSSRSFPFVSKVSGYNFIEIAIGSMLNTHKKITYQTLDLDHVAVKTPQFSYNRLKGADPVAGVEMASTGEVACFGDTLEEAFYRSWHATEQQIKGKRLFVSVPDEQKYKFIDELKALKESGWQIYATKGTHDYYKKFGILTKQLHKIQENLGPSVSDIIQNQKVDLMINVPATIEQTKDAYSIRRMAIDHHIPLFTNAETGNLMLRCLANPKLQNLPAKSWSDYLNKNH